MSTNLCSRHGWMLSPRFELVACLQQLASIELRALTTSWAPVYNDVIMVTVGLIAVPLPLTLSTSSCKKGWTSSSVFSSHRCLLLPSKCLSGRGGSGLAQEYRYHIYPTAVTCLISDINSREIGWRGRLGLVGAQFSIFWKGQPGALGSKHQPLLSVASS